MTTPYRHRHRYCSHAPKADGKALGNGNLRDFRTLASVVATLERGIYLNFGSAVVSPEVFLNAVSLARNLGHPLRHLTTVNLDVNLPTYVQRGFGLESRSN